ncbi:uncharacterized protein LOC110033929 [Phalaenopsis equestris]|uniref:uncharacterized protein LOC110033929 n=1 Tax=Phalaenopsis equestris TaxID=78828 RepID=UPI0009E195EC|nr:uncharacterized protein LOC110033929 [Phalaenopsis equestris]
MASSINQLLPFSLNQTTPCPPFPLSKYTTLTIPGHGGPAKLRLGFRFPISAPRSSPSNQALYTDSDDDGVSLGTMKLPADTDITLFQTLLFQWANSLCQGATLPLPVPLQIDKVEGGVRLGFINVVDGKTEVFAYIDCLVYPASERTGPVFRATRNGPLKSKIPPGEERIMRSLLQALQKSVEIARL